MNKKTLLIIIASVLAVAISVVLIVVLVPKQGGTTDSSDNPSSSEPKKYNYIISGNDYVLPDAEVGEMYIFTMPSVLDKSGQTVTTYKVKVGELTDPSGKKQVVAAGRFSPKSIGEYTVVFTCDNDEVKDLTVKFIVKDTIAPEIDVTSVPACIFISDNNAKPDFKVRDVGGVDEASKEVELYTSTGEQIAYDGNKFCLTEEGIYTYRFTVKDISGNVAVAEKQIFVSSAERVDGQLTYLNENSYDMQISNDYDAALTYDWSDVKDPDGNGTIAIKTDNIHTIRLTFNCAITDWSDYDYVAFWIYNPTDIHLAVGFESVGTLSYVLNPKAWTYACFGFNVSFVDPERNPLPVNNRPKMVLYVGDRFTMDNTEATEAIPKDSEFYVSDFRLYKDTSDNIFSLGEKYGYYQQSIHQKFMEYTVELSTEIRHGDDPYSTKFTMVNIKNSFNFIVYSDKNCPTDDYYVFLNIYNANDYEVAFIDLSCDGFAEIIDSGNGNLTTRIAANSWGKVLCKVDWDACGGSLYMMALHPDGREIQNGAVFYVGNSKVSDIYTGDVTNWNEENGVVGLYEMFKKKNPILSQ